MTLRPVLIPGKNQVSHKWYLENVVVGVHLFIKNCCTEKGFVHQSTEPMLLISMAFHAE